MEEVDYSSMYIEYWSRPDRWGSSSFNDVEDITRRILSTCGSGSVLDVGCGMGYLVRALLRKGVDARGIDVAQNTIDYCNLLAPGCYEVGSILRIPYSDNVFHTVVTTDVLEHLSMADVPKAVAELYRVAERYVFIILSTAPDRDGTWHLTIQNREWWEKEFFVAGFRKHPRIQAILPFESLEQEPDQITLLFEKIPPSAFDAYGLELLDSQRCLHMDMLRDTGRRSDAHIARYNLACSFVRSGDVVLDVACGLGYGSAIVAAGSPAARVLGVDSSPFAIEYARQNYACGSLVEFYCGDAAHLDFLEDESVDYVVSFETLEHVSDPNRFLKEMKRVLRPSGRILVSVPNEWTDETGSDPNPHHLHVYTLDRLNREIAENFLIEKVYSQVAGGAQKLTDGKRSLKELPIGALQDEAEWWLMLAMKNPVSADRRGYRETSFPDYSGDDNYNITSFGRDYDNPWLVKGMVSIGMRMSTSEELVDLAEVVLAKGRPGSADVGAAICILAYHVLSQKEARPQQINRILEYVTRYHAEADHNANAWRWRISNQFASAQLLLAMGDREKAEGAFRSCGEMDSLKFSPLLATKTVDAWYHAGLLAASDTRLDAARECWTRALKEAERAAHCDWLNVWGTAEKPTSFGLPEMAQVIDKATRAAYALLALDLWAYRPGWSWNQASLGMAHDLEAWRGVANSRLEWVEYLKQQLALHAEWLKDRDNQLTLQAQRVADRDYQLVLQAQNLAERDKQVAEQAKQLEEQGKQLAELDRQIHEILDSYSWKITKPLREVGSLLLRCHRRKGAEG